MSARGAQAETFKTDRDAIAVYCRSCRDRVPVFLTAHYSFETAWRIQKENLRHDLWKLPLNALWAITFLGLKKIAESLDKVGWSSLLSRMEDIPAGFKTALQNHYENKIATELFKVEGVPVVKTGLVQKELKKYATGRTVLASFSSTVTTLVLGRLLLKQGNLDIFGLVGRMSENLAKERAASGFVFGKSMGRAFYSVVRPDVSWLDMVTAAAVFFAFLTVIALVLSTLYFPVRNMLGLEKKKLHKMINEIEERLLVDAHKS